ncbi:hypothetical protein [Roseibium aggregatum]|uniref:Uncharacterized protein n=1 Tax=Roseibium aggregatum TaxID=187304 RepID=A0A926P236_9HYPH|nr:hypothetical protein [Roseibium aggregatum]MBD1548088.1 hypothetical protein [Roseibium aggregatum]
MAAGALVAAAAFVAPMLLRVPPVSVVVVRSQNADVVVERRDLFYGGTYHGRDGARLAVPTDRRFGRTATILINDSDRLVTVTGYSYSVVPNAAGSADLMAYLLPGEAQVFPRRIDTFGSDADGPPKEIVSESAVGFRSYLAYGAEPYKDVGSPTVEELDAALTMPPGRALKGLSPVAD